MTLGDNIVFKVYNDSSSVRQVIIGVVVDVCRQGHGIISNKIDKNKDHIRVLRVIRVIRI